MARMCRMSDLFIFFQKLDVDFSLLDLICYSSELKKDSLWHTCELECSSHAHRRTEFLWQMSHKKIRYI